MTKNKLFNKSLNSPTPIVSVKGNFINIFTNTINAPEIGPIANPPIRAGKSEIFSFKKDGNAKASGIFIKYKTKLNAERIDICAIRLVVKNLLSINNPFFYLTNACQIKQYKFL